jgi:hypothetical protein
VTEDPAVAHRTALKPRVEEDELVLVDERVRQVASEEAAPARQ